MRGQHDHQIEEFVVRPRGMEKDNDPTLAGAAIDQIPWHDRLPTAMGTSIDGSGKRNRPRKPPRAVKKAESRRAFAPCVTAMSIWYSHQDAPQSWIWDVPVKGERASATDVASHRSTEDTNVSGKTGIGIKSPDLYAARRRHFLLRCGRFPGWPRAAWHRSVPPHPSVPHGHQY